MRFRNFLLLALGLPTLSFGDVFYTLTPEPQNGSVRVTIRLPEPNESESFRIPAWCPGFYFVQQYQTKIFDFRAVDSDGNGLKVDHTKDPRQWIVASPQKKALTVSYRVLGDDPGLGFFGTNVIAHTSFVNGPSAFMFIEGRLQEPTKLNVKLPENWKIATAADPAEDGSFKASGYDELIDHPIQMGEFETRRFTLNGIPFEVAYVSRDKRYLPNLDEETNRLKAVSAPAIKMFGGAPFKRYLYLIHLNVGAFGGGLEHRASNVINTFNSKKLDIDDLAAHEFFHAWNVKQIRPKILGPFDYTKEQRTGNLWFSEGVTDYYAQITTYRSGLQTKEWLLRQLASNMAELQRSQVRKQYPISEVSRIAWEHGGFAVRDLSYYTKGLLIGWILDAIIRDETDGTKSLDDVLRVMYDRHRLPKPGFEENGIIAVINEVTETDLTAVYNRMVNSTNELPYDLLAKIGLIVDPATGTVIENPTPDPKAAALRKGWLERPGSVN